MVRIRSIHAALSLVLTGSAAVFPQADVPAQVARPTFLHSKARLLMAGGVEMGSTSLFPSPILLDLDGDGVREMVIGDLLGFIRISRRTPKGWGPVAKLKAVDGKDLKFSNW